jgi:uroporphyrinogen decarboxylase
MTHLERWKNTFDRAQVDRLPTFYSATTEFSESLADHLGEDLPTILHEYFDIDYRFQNDGFEAKAWEPGYIGPLPKTYPDGTFDNIWGSRQKRQNYGKGQYTETFQFALGNATGIAEIDRHPWPKADWYDYESVLPILERFPDYPFMLGYLAIGWFAWEVRGMEQFMVDLVQDDGMAEAIIDRIADFGYEYFSRLIEAAKAFLGRNFVALHIADDWGAQEGLLLGSETFDRYFSKHYRRITDLAHRNGLKVEFHSCGSAIGLYDRFADVGVDIMNPVQTSARGMDPAVIKRSFGERLCFSGGIDVQQVLPRMSPAEVKAEVHSVIDSLGRGGGYMPGPTHNIQAGTPVPNVIAMYQAIHEHFGTLPARLRALKV